MSLERFHGVDYIAITTTSVVCIIFDNLLLLLPAHFFSFVAIASVARCKNGWFAVISAECQ